MFGLAIVLFYLPKDLYGMEQSCEPCLNSALSRCFVVQKTTTETDTNSKEIVDIQVILCHTQVLLATVSKYMRQETYKGEIAEKYAKLVSVQVCWIKLVLDTIQYPSFAENMRFIRYCEEEACKYAHRAHCAAALY